MLHQSSNFKGIMRHGTENKISLYADDVLLYVSSPATSLPQIISLLKEFGKFSGYKLNMNKSEFFPITPTSYRDSSFIPFRVVCEGFKYLGVQVTRSFNKLFKANFCPLLDRCKKDFVKWSSLPLSLAGRTNLIKMSVLPWFLYLFSNIPIFIRQNFFTKLDSLITSFLWGNKTPRIRKTFYRD